MFTRAEYLADATDDENLISHELRTVDGNEWFVAKMLYVGDPVEETHYDIHMLEADGFSLYMAGCVRSPTDDQIRRMYTFDPTVDAELNG